MEIVKLVEQSRCKFCASKMEFQVMRRMQKEMNFVHTPDANHSNQTDTDWMAQFEANRDISFK